LILIAQTDVPPVRFGEKISGGKEIIIMADKVNVLEITKEETVNAAVINVKTTVGRARQMGRQIATQLRQMLDGGSNATGVTGDDLKNALGADAVQQVNDLLAKLDAVAE
jgi:hypothetical protein